MNEPLETRPKTLGDICAEHGVETARQLDQFVTEMDQELMKKQAWDYANPGFPNNVIVANLERVDQRHFSPIAKFWVNQIIWFWYHHAISCAREMYRSPTRALAFAAVHPLIDGGQNQQREDGGRDEAADDDNGQRLLRFGADAVAEGGGQQAQRGHQGRHNHGAQPRFGSFLDGGH